MAIILATHSELLASYINTLRADGDEIMFYSMYVDNDAIKYDSNDRFDLLNPNKLTEEPVKLYELEIERGLG